MSTLTAADLPAIMASELERFGPDLDETSGVYALAAGSHYTMSELIEHMPEAIAIAEMARNAKRDLERFKADLEAELRR